MTEANLETEERDLSGLREILGIRLIEWERDRAVVEMAIDERHLNRSGLVHGGIYATLLDSALGFAGCHVSTPGELKRAVTLSLTTNFIASVKSGTIRTQGRRTGGGKSIFFGEGEVRDGDGRLLASGSGTFRYLSGLPR